MTPRPGCGPIGLQPLVARLPTLTHFILYSRAYCHLCDDMLAALQAFSGEFAFTVEVVHVDADLDLVAQYDELVPVLLARKCETDAAVQLCHYFLDEARLRVFLASS